MSEEFMGLVFESVADMLNAASDGEFIGLDFESVGVLMVNKTSDWELEGLVLESVAGMPSGASAADGEEFVGLVLESVRVGWLTQRWMDNSRTHLGNSRSGYAERKRGRSGDEIA